jgi:hypothetical protein
MPWTTGITASREICRCTFFRIGWKTLIAEKPTADEQVVTKSGQESRQESGLESKIAQSILKALETQPLQRGEIAKALGHGKVSGVMNLVREIDEEMGVKVTITCSLKSFTYKYPSVMVTLYPFICYLKKEEPMPLEHAALQWLPLDQLYTLDWAEADIPVLDEYFRLRRR